MNLKFNEIGNLPPGRYEIAFDDAKSFFVGKRQIGTR